MKFCIKCGGQLEDVFGGETVFTYCYDRNCSRYGLVTIVENQKPEKKRAKIKKGG